jgi:hypothetical protein
MNRRPALPLLAGAILVLLGLAVFLAAHHAIVRNPTGTVLQAGDTAFDPIREDEIQSILPQDAIPALVHPTYLTAAQASDIRPEELVIGVAINGDARAYPLATLSAHEIVNDDIGGQHLAVTW